MKTLRDASAQREIRVRLESLTSKDCARSGKMSVHQMICHLGDSYWVGLGEKKVSMVSIPMPRPVMKWMALQVPLHWPHGLKSPPEVAQDVDGRRPVETESDRPLFSSRSTNFAIAWRRRALYTPFLAA